MNTSGAPAPPVGSRSLSAFDGLSESLMNSPEGTGSPRLRLLPRFMKRTQILLLVLPHPVRSMSLPAPAGRCARFPASAAERSSHEGRTTCVKRAGDQSRLALHCVRRAQLHAHLQAAPNPHGGARLDTPASPPVEIVPISRLFCSPTNPRRNDAAIPHVAASIRRFGWQQPIVARRSGEVIAGNPRIKAAQQLGMTEVPVWWFDGSDLDALSFAIADNRSHEHAEWNDAELVQILEQLKKEDALDGVGFSTDDIDALVAQLREEEDRELTDDGPDEPPALAIAKPGDWCLGEHRLLCGDSTKIADVHRVMAGETAALVATDPPYCVNYVGERPNDAGKDWSASYREVDIEDSDGFFRSVFANVLDVLGPHAAIYTWHAHKRCGEIQRIWRDLGILDHQSIVWIKPTSVFGRVYWHFRHEHCLMGWRQGSKPEH